MASATERAYRAIAVAHHYGQMSEAELAEASQVYRTWKTAQRAIREARAVDHDHLTLLVTGEQLIGLAEALRGRPVDLHLAPHVTVPAGETTDWRRELPNGTYRVAVTVGDAQGPHRVDVEGVRVFDDRWTRPGELTTTDVTATVEDGFLCLTLGGGPGPTVLHAVAVRSCGEGDCS